MLIKKTIKTQIEQAVDYLISSMGWKIYPNKTHSKQWLVQTTPYDIAVFSDDAEVIEAAKANGFKVKNPKL